MSKLNILDGAMGSLLHENEYVKHGQQPEVMNITHPADIIAIHKEYIEAGSKYILTNTFGANDNKYGGSNYSVEELITAGVNNAKKAIAETNKDIKLCLDIGPLGVLLAPLGSMDFETACDMFKKQIRIGLSLGIDIIYIETMTDVYEARCAVIAAKDVLKEYSLSIPIFCTMSFEKNLFTYTGTSIESMACIIGSLGVSALGFNCSTGPSEMVSMVRRLRELTDLPIIAKPNAGIPYELNGKTVYDMSEKEFSSYIPELIEAGVSFIGGCCGTAPSYIREILKEDNTLPSPEKRTLCTYVCSAYKAVPLDRIRIIGERINPTGKKKFQRALLENDMSYILSQASAQIDSGADILDVNTGMPGIDEEAVMVNVIKELQRNFRVPLQIDSSNEKVIEKALRVYNGRAIVNSVNAEDSVLDRILPIVKYYGACIIGLTLDSKGIPNTSKERLELAKHVKCRANSFGIEDKDIIIDCLTLTAGAKQDIALETVKAIKLVKEELGLKTVLGVSNISFGLPGRDKLNLAFLTLALSAGLDLPIMNPDNTNMVDAVYCHNQLFNIDKGSVEYTDRFSLHDEASPQERDIKGQVQYSVLKGNRAEVIELCTKLMDSYSHTDIIDNYLIPSLDEVGRQYEANTIYLPQLLRASEAAGAAFDLLRSSMKDNNGCPFCRSDDIIVLATVKGDIHDIGKNIVKTVLENYGYHCIDLGRDVPAETVLDAVKKNNAALVGLSALMTTTLKSMKETITLLKKEVPSCKIMVGGAVLTKDYASEIGADFYAKDAHESTVIAGKVFGR